MVAAQENKSAVCLPSLCEHLPPHTGNYSEDYDVGILPNPKIMLQYVDVDAAVMIADTGCQRQVAGRAWHERRCHEIEPLFAIPFKEFCKFSFGPNEGVPSTQRLAYPAGLGGGLVVLGISEVEVNAPALFSRSTRRSSRPM